MAGFFPKVGPDGKPVTGYPFTLYVYRAAEPSDGLRDGFVIDVSETPRGSHLIGRGRFKSYRMKGGDIVVVSRPKKAGDRLVAEIYLTLEGVPRRRVMKLVGTLRVPMVSRPREPFVRPPALPDLPD